MKKEWKMPELQILDVSETFAPGGGKGPGGEPGNACNTPAQQHNPWCQGS